MTTQENRSVRVITQTLILILGLVAVGCSTRDDATTTAETDKPQPTIEGKLRYHMVFGGLFDEGLAMGPPTYFIEAQTGTYLLSFDKDCELVNIDELRPQPGFESLIDGTSEGSSAGSGPVMEVPGRVRARGAVQDTERTISGTNAKELRATYFEYIKPTEQADHASPPPGQASHESAQKNHVDRPRKAPEVMPSEHRDALQMAVILCVRDAAFNSVALSADMEALFEKYPKTKYEGFQKGGSYATPAGTFFRS